MPPEISPPDDISPAAGVAFPIDITPADATVGAGVAFPIDITPAKAEQPRTSVRITVALSLRTFFMDLSPSKGSESETQLLRLDTGSVFTEQSRYKKADGGRLLHSLACHKSCKAPIISIFPLFSNKFVTTSQLFWLSRRVAVYVSRNLIAYARHFFTRFE